MSLADLAPAVLARVAREYLLAGHVIDRVGLPQVLGAGGPDLMQRVAIEEWMGASPVYTRRTRRALGFDGDDVPTIFKGLQLDVGFAHQYMDVAYEVHDEHHGEFRLRSCGALIDVEPMGEDLVRRMCHDIEDPTFDATAVATNSRAQVRPVHRPPRAPGAGGDHCRWTVTIDDAHPPVSSIPLTDRIAATALAATEPLRVDRPGPGLSDYAGPFRPDFTLEDLAPATLIAAANEFLVQIHLLTASFHAATAAALDPDLAAAAVVEQWTGTSWIASERLHDVLGGGDDLTSVLAVAAVHPSFPPTYAPVRLERLSPALARLHVLDGPAHAEPDPLGWWATFDDGATPPALDAMVHGVNRSARLERVESPGAVATYDVWIDRDAEPVPEPPAVGLARLSGSSDFTFVDPPRRR